MKDARNTWHRTSRREAYRNPWISIDHDEVITPGGSSGIYGVVRFANVAIGIVTLDSERHTVLVGQWRYPFDDYSWEIPEGGGAKHADPLVAAKRELLEETGLTAKRWTRLLDLQLSNSVTDETGIVYLAEDLTQGQAAPEDTEDLSLRRVPFEEAVEMALRGEIRDAVAVVGLLAAERLLRTRGN